MIGMRLSLGCTLIWTMDVIYMMLQPLSFKKVKKAKTLVTAAVTQPELSNTQQQHSPFAPPLFRQYG